MAEAVGAYSVDAAAANNMLMASLGRIDLSLEFPMTPSCRKRWTSNNFFDPKTRSREPLG
jgi:hypothetical protein